MVLMFLSVQRLRLLTLPKAEWGPALLKHRQLINYVDGFVVDPWASAAKAHTPVAFDNAAVVYSINAMTSDAVSLIYTVNPETLIRIQISDLY